MRQLDSFGAYLERRPGAHVAPDSPRKPQWRRRRPVGFWGHFYDSAFDEYSSVPSLRVSAYFAPFRRYLSFFSFGAYFATFWEQIRCGSAALPLGSTCIGGVVDLWAKAGGRSPRQLRPGQDGSRWGLRSVISGLRYFAG